jgi:hypothetical protein
MEERFTARQIEDIDLAFCFKDHIEEVPELMKRKISLR